MQRDVLFWFIKYDIQNITLKITAIKIKLYRAQIYSNIFCELKIPQ